MADLSLGRDRSPAARNRLRRPVRKEVTRGDEPPCPLFRSHRARRLSRPAFLRDPSRESLPLLGAGQKGRWEVSSPQSLVRTTLSTRKAAELKPPLTPNLIKMPAGTLLQVTEQPTPAFQAVLMKHVAWP